jgi:hypothetical protein
VPGTADQPRDDERVAQKIARDLVRAKYKSGDVITDPRDIRILFAGPTTRKHPEGEGLVYFTNDF